MARLIVMEHPFTTGQMKEALRGEDFGYISGVVAMDFHNLVEEDYETVLNMMSEKLTGTDLLTDITYELVGVEDSDVLVRIRGDVSNIVELDDETDSYDDVDEY